MYRNKYIQYYQHNKMSKCSITITFTEQQFQALKNILNNAEPDEARWVEEHYDYEEKQSDGAAEVLQRLDELDVETHCTYRYIQQVRVAMRTVVWKNLNEKKVEEDKDEEDTITEEQFIKMMDRQGETWKDLCRMLFNRTPADELAELTEEWKKEYEKEEEEEEEEDEDEEEEKWRARLDGSSDS